MNTRVRNLREALSRFVDSIPTWHPSRDILERILDEMQKMEKQMDANQYQKDAITMAVYPYLGANFVYPALGLAGEAGEVCEKVKKIMRDKEGRLSEDDRKAIAIELGDAQWYLSAMAKEIGYELGQVMEMNLEKLRSRKMRGVLKGEGDNR
ncbi:ntP-ppase [Caudoviricetes sp.]|nr:ntP-ppase [Caudoviricetes sp.]